MNKILFVCAGNTCRSPMAEALGNHYAKTNGMDNQIVFKSAGIAAFNGDPANEKSIAVMSEVGLNIDDHRSQRLTPNLMEEFDQIYIMSDDYYNLVLEAYPDKTSKVYLLGDGVEDPYGSDIEEYRFCRTVIDGYVKNIIETIKINGI